MLQESEVPAITVRLAAPGEKPVLAAMLGAYLVELGQYGAVDTNYPYFDAYWLEPDSRWPYLVMLGNVPCGFALVNRWSPSGKGTDFAVAEFYIAPAARRHGAGVEAAALLLSGRPGLWELAVFCCNGPALAFWPKAIVRAGAAMPERIEDPDTVIYRFRISPEQA